MLNKRLSSHSIQMSEEYGSAMSRSTHERRSATGRRPSAIPRPSMTQERPTMTQDRSASGSSQKSGTGGKVPTVKRTRTQSTPYPYDRDSGGATIPPIPAPFDQVHSTTPSSPRKTDDRSSKIPKASSGLRSDSYGGSGSFYLQTRMNSARRQLPDQRMEVDESGAIPNSLSYKIRNTQILHEPPPFSPSVSSMLSSDLQYEQSRLVGVYTQEAAPRPSTDSVERPFEHWYRGESTRNGGVGELRVGRSEMLDIAQFGHRPQPRVNPMSGIVTMSVANAASLFVSRRHGSLDRSRSGERESWFIDDKTREAMRFGGTVMDESPLTDLEDVDATTEGPESVIGHRGRQRSSWRASGRQEDNATQSSAAQEQYSIRSASTPPFASMDAIVQQPPPMVSSTSMGTAASLVRENSKKSTKSTKSSKSTTLTAGRRTPTSTKAMPTTSAKGAAVAAANGTPSAARSAASKVPVVTQKAKVKAAAKPKPRPAPKSTPAATSEVVHLASDSTTDDTLVDAIPVFSTPVPRGGNWDDMILPTVAKKLGLEGYAVRTENGVIAKNDVVLPNKRATLIFPVSGDKNGLVEGLSNGCSRLQGHLGMITRRYTGKTMSRRTSSGDSLSPSFSDLNLCLLHLYPRGAAHGRSLHLRLQNISRKLLPLNRHRNPSHLEQG